MMKRNVPVSPTTSNQSTNKVILVERNARPEGVNLVSTVAVAKKAPNDLVELAMEIEKAQAFVETNTCSKLQVIAEQVRFLQSQARKILQEAKLNADLHTVACNFKKIPGNTYYLYQRDSGQQYFGMLSPQEWLSCPHKFLGGYRLEADHSWTPEHKIHDRDADFNLIKEIMIGNNEISIQHEIEDIPMES